MKWNTTIPDILTTATVQVDPCIVPFYIPEKYGVMQNSTIKDIFYRAILNRQYNANNHLRILILWYDLLKELHTRK